MLRKEGIYSSILSAWRTELGAHGAAGLATKKPGRKPKLTEAERTQLSTKAHPSLEGAGAPLLSAVLRHRVTFGEAMASGQGVVTYEPQSDAAAEVRRMTKEILGVLRG